MFSSAKNMLANAATNIVNTSKNIITSPEVKEIGKNVAKDAVTAVLLYNDSESSNNNNHLYQKSEFTYNSLFYN